MARFVLILLCWCVASVAPAAAQVEQQPLGQPAAAERGPLGQGPAGQPGSTASTIASLAAVVALMVTCFAGYKYLASRAGGLTGQVASVGAPAGVLDLLGRYPLGRGQTLLLLKIDRRLLLISQTVGSRVGSAPTMATLCEITDPDEVSAILARIDRPKSNFGDIIATFNKPAGGRDAPPPSDGVEIVDLTRGDNPFARLTGLARRRA